MSKAVLLAGLLVALAVYLPPWLEERRLTTTYNELVVGFVNQGQYREAVPGLELLLEKAKGTLKAFVEDSLIVCYRELLKSEEATPDEKARYRKRLLELDPSMRLDELESDRSPQ